MKEEDDPKVRTRTTGTLDVSQLGEHMLMFVFVIAQILHKKYLMPK